MAIQKVNIIIAGRSFPVKAEEDEIDVIREIEKNINRKINEYSSIYKTENKVDIITLILLNCSLENYNLNRDKGEDKDILNLISDIENSIDKVL